MIIKSSPQGMAIRLDPELPFEELKKQIEDKFTDAADFFKDAKATLSFEGRELTEEEEEAILEIIDRTTQLKILCIVEKEPPLELTEEQEQRTESSGNPGQFFRGDLHSGQVLESETSIIIIGDVAPGAKIIAQGHVIVLGRLQGTVYAGAGGRQNAFVAALFMEPAQIKIGTYKRKGRTGSRRSSLKPKIAHVEGGMICFDIIS